MNDKIKALWMAQYLGQQVQITYSKVAFIDTLTPVYQLTGLSGTSIKLKSKANAELWYSLLEVDFDKNMESISLLLRTVDMLTDDEAVKLAYLAMYHPSIEDYSLNEVWIGEGDTRPNGGTWLEIGCRCWVGELGIEPDGHMFLVGEDSEREDAIYEPIRCIDYLRSIGIILPFTYLSEDNQPVTLTPAEIIALGWAKIQ